MSKYTQEQLLVAAAELRLAGVDVRVVRHYLHCGDHSVLSMLDDLQAGVHDVAWYNKQYAEWLLKIGKIEA